MNNNLTKRIVAYILHDPIGNVEGYIAEYDTEQLRAAEEHGMLIIAEYNDGSRECVHAGDVTEPAPALNGVDLVQPVYVDERMKAVVNVFDALAKSFLTSRTKRSATSMSSRSIETGETFLQALKVLKELVIGDDE